MEYYHHWQHSMSAMLLSDSTACPNFSRNFVSWPWEFFYLLFGAMSTNVIKQSLYVSFIFAHIFCSRALPYMWFASTSLPESFADISKTLHFVILHFESLFLPSHWLSPPSIKKQDEKGVSGNPTIVNRLELHQRFPSLVSLWSLPRVEV